MQGRLSNECNRLCELFLKRSTVFLLVKDDTSSDFGSKHSRFVYFIAWNRAVSCKYSAKGCLRSQHTDEQIWIYRERIISQSERSNTWGSIKIKVSSTNQL